MFTGLEQMRMNGFTFQVSDMKASYFGQCDRLRRKPGGEEAWQGMMRNKRKVSMSTFLRKVDVSDILEDGETVEDFVADDPDSAFYESDWNGRRVWFLQTSGFEFIFGDKNMNRVNKIANRIKNDKSKDPTVVEYAVRSLFKGKSVKSAANYTVKKLSGQDNLFLGDEVYIDPKRLVDALWERLVEFSLHDRDLSKPIHTFTIDATLDYFNQKITTRTRAELKKRITKRVGRNPFVEED